MLYSKVLDWIKFSTYVNLRIGERCGYANILGCNTDIDVRHEGKRESSARSLIFLSRTHATAIALTAAQYMNRNNYKIER